MDDNSVSFLEPEKTKTESGDKIYTTPEITDNPVITQVVATDIVGEQLNTSGSRGTVVDREGLVSVNNFNATEVQQTTEQVTNSTIYADISGCSMTFTLPRPTNVFFIVSSLLYYYDGSDLYRTMLLGLNVDGVIQRPWMVKDLEISIVDFVSQNTIQKLMSLDAGEHIAKLQFKVSNSDITGAADEITFTRILLGN